jgi:hypothetical protein
MPAPDFTAEVLKRIDGLQIGQWLLVRPSSAEIDPERRELRSIRAYAAAAWGAAMCCVDFDGRVLVLTRAPPPR